MSFFVRRAAVVARRSLLLTQTSRVLFFSTAPRTASAAPAKPPSIGSPPGAVGVEKLSAVPKAAKPAGTSEEKCGTDPLEDEREDEDMVEMVDPKTGEWGGPTKGGRQPEPTRFGDWERKGRCTDFS